MYKNILLAIDGSKNSIRAAKEAFKVAMIAEESHITVVLVAEFSKAKKEVIHARGKEELELARRKKLLPVIKKLEEKAISYQVQILHGEPGPTIIEYANK